MDHRVTASNRLATETSPYLLQHAENPVHWWPWCDAAFTEAKASARPILLSVGYSACHWCHVMAHESFEDPAIAGQMNRDFVNIKVDREEHPDVDAIYQEALALMGQQGGWPLTIFLSPEREPFWGGTYFPKSPQFGRPGFSAVLTALTDAFQNKTDQIDAQRTALARHMKERHQADLSGGLTATALIEAGSRFLALFDPRTGGLKGAPKFPQLAILSLMWACWHQTGDAAYLEAHNLTLEKICQGGIYDHLGGGFARYSVDEKWLVPHFEKMLYDNALLIEALTRAWQATGNDLFKTRVEETVAWLLREMTVEGGGFTAALDADSEGVEGKFYVWSQDAINAALGDEAAFFSSAYGVKPAGNWAEGETEDGKSANILNRLHETAPPAEEEKVRLATSRAKLLALREGRIRPGRDDKVLADWNGLTIAALAQAARVFSRPDWLTAAERALAFVSEEMSNVDDAARLSHSWCGRAAERPALLDDYANMIRAAVFLAEASSASRAAHLLAKTRAWAAVLVDDFLDQSAGKNKGGFFIAPRQSSDLIVRARHAHDGPVPSGNAMAAEALTRLAALTGEGAYRDQAAEVVAAFAGGVQTELFAHAGLLTAYAFLETALEIVVIGIPDNDAVRDVLAAVYSLPLPCHSLIVSAAKGDLPATHPAYAKTGAPGTIYICRAGTCSSPLAPDPDDPEGFMLALRTAANIPQAALSAPLA